MIDFILEWIWVVPLVVLQFFVHEAFYGPKFWLKKGGNDSE